MQLLGDIVGTGAGLLILTFGIYLLAVSMQDKWTLLLTSFSVVGVIIGIGVIVMGLRQGVIINSSLQRLKQQYTVTDSEEMYPSLREDQPSE